MRLRCLRCRHMDDDADCSRSSVISYQRVGTSSCSRKTPSFCPAKYTTLDRAQYWQSPSDQEALTFLSHVPLMSFHTISLLSVIYLLCFLDRANSKLATTRGCALGCTR